MRGVLASSEDANATPRRSTVHLSRGGGDRRLVHSQTKLRLSFQQRTTRLGSIDPTRAIAQAEKRFPKQNAQALALQPPYLAS